VPKSKSRAIPLFASTNDKLFRASVIAVSQITTERPTGLLNNPEDDRIVTSACTMYCVT
jgi:hypothetical protein